MKPIHKITLLVFAVFISTAFVIVGCDSDMVIDGPEGDSETTTGPEAGPAPEKGKDIKEKTPKFGEFASADVVVTITLNGRVINTAESKVYNTEDATRTETDMPLGMGEDAPSINTIIIDRRDLGVTWQLYPGSKKYIESEIITDPGEGMPTMNIHDILYSGDYKLEKIGTEEVNGYDCEKYILYPGTETLPDITIWSAKKLDNVVVKTQVDSPDGTSMTNELFNVKTGKQPANLFELPGGYTKATEEEIGMIMMQEMMGQ